MTCSVLVLTTETPHHVFFASQLVTSGIDIRLICESAPPAARTASSLAELQAEYERRRWFNGSPPRMSQVAPTQYVQSINTISAWGSADDFDIAVCFGTRILTRAAIGRLPIELWNVHGGDPQRYRGLDSHLWAAWNGDERGFVTVLHRLEPEVDSGELIGCAELPIGKAPQLHMLRAINTEAAVEIAVAAVQTIQSKGAVPSKPQAQRGRYYSSIPGHLIPAAAARYSLLVSRVSGGDNVSEV
jgi:methionyl-tRNA formyltransferase